MINKYVHKYLARKKGNEIIIWSWNKSNDRENIFWPLRQIRPETDEYMKKIQNH